MKRNRLQSIAISVYFVLFISFALFMMYIGLCERNELYNTRTFHGAYTLQPETEMLIADTSAPAGVRRAFTWTMPDVGDTENCLAFYLVHHYAEVWFDDELVYSLTRAEGNRISHTPNSNWVMLPIYASDSGREVRVVLTPAYESVINRSVEFEFGSRYAIVIRQVTADLPQLISSVLCIVAGLMLLLLPFFLSYRQQALHWEQFPLGLFTLLVGLWRLTDTRSSPLLFPQNPLLLGYLTLGALFLAAPPLLLYMRNHYPGSSKALLVTALLSCIPAGIVLVCQLLGLADFREMLSFIHVSLLIALTVLLFICLSNARRGMDQGKFWKFILLLAAAFALDMATFYISKSSSGIMFTIWALLAYSVSRFVDGILAANRKAYTDLLTGLLNKNHWDELMHMPWHQSDTLGIIMLDLNQLKKVNDTMGHEAGDKAIHNFANILRNTIPPTNTICRWGGDEFTVLITNATREKMEQYVAAVEDAVTKYNHSGETPQIHYAAGWVLSSEFPELTPTELLAKADKRMYVEKRRWHAFHD
ncbi:MAG: GGDEF domain-containing protein [Aristaeellaceae bacterium]